METGVFLPGHWFDTNRPMAEIYRDLVDQAVLAEELGYDAVWFAEHYFNNYVATPAPSQLAALAGSRTSRIKMGIAVFVLPFHHPLKLAGELTQLDALTEGRVVACMGRGAFPFEAHQLGITMSNEESRSFCEESVEVLAKSMRSRMKAVSHKGELWEFDNVTIIPPAHAEGTPDIWMAAQTAESATWAVNMFAQNGLRPNIFCSQLRRPFELIEEVHEAFAKALSDNGLDRAEGTFAVNTTTFVANTDEEAIEEVFKTIYPINRGVWNMQKVGGDAIGFVRDGIVTEASSMENEPTREQLIDNTTVGSIDTVLEKVHRYRDLGVDHLAMHMNIGLDAAVVESSMRLAAEHILPTLS